MALLRTDPVRGVMSEATLSDGAGLLSFAGSKDDSRDMPGRPLRPDTKLSLDVDSSLLFINAALPAPRSADCLNHDGSRDPKDAAI